MKVLVNGGLNCSILDGWWDEAYDTEVGWAIGDGCGGPVEEADARDADSLYEVLETRVVPEFYDRDAAGLPRAWLGRVRKSMSTLTPAFSSTRMIQEYLENAYLPLAQAVRQRAKDGFASAKAMNEWARSLHERWSTLQTANPTVSQNGTALQFIVPVNLGEVPPSAVRIELFADAKGELPPEVVLLHQEHSIPGSGNGFIYAGAVEHLARQTITRCGWFRIIQMGRCPPSCRSSLGSFSRRGKAFEPKPGRDASHRPRGND